MKDKLGDLIPWLEKLLVTLAKVDPNGDREEVERRSQLEKFVSCLQFRVYSKPILSDRSLDDIGRRSLALSEKGKVARILDKMRDSQEVISLVEKLRQAILVYQVSNRRETIAIWDNRTVTGITTTINLRPGCPFDRRFLLLVSDFRRS